MTNATRVRAKVFPAFALALLAGCSQLEPVPPTQPVTDPTQLYLRLTLNHAAINLSTDTTQPAYYTAQLVATPYDGTGTPIVGAPAPTFTSLDTSAVTVTPDGLLRAHGATNEARVVATLAIGAVRHSDTALVRIRDLAPPPVLDTLSIHVPPESAVWYVRPPTAAVQTATEIIANFAQLIPSRTLSVRAIDNAGNPMAGLAINYVSLDPAVALVDRRSGRVTPITAGHVRIVARSLAYGVAKADTMTYTVQGPFAADISIDSLGFLSDNQLINVRPPTLTITIAAGGLVSWGSVTAQPMDVTFDDPTNVAAPPAAYCNILAAFAGPGPYCGSGNIATLYLDPTTGVGPDGTLPLRTRQFPVPGTYPFHSTTTGAAGKIVVLEPVPLP